MGPDRSCFEPQQNMRHLTLPLRLATAIRCATIVLTRCADDRRRLDVRLDVEKVARHLHRECGGRIALGAHAQRPDAAHHPMAHDGRRGEVGQQADEREDDYPIDPIGTFEYGICRTADRVEYDIHADSLAERAQSIKAGDRATLELRRTPQEHSVSKMWTIVRVLGVTPASQLIAERRAKYGLALQAADQIKYPKVLCVFLNYQDMEHSEIIARS